MKTLRAGLSTAQQTQVTSEGQLAKNTDTLNKAKLFIEQLAEALEDKKSAFQKMKASHSKALAESFATGEDIKPIAHDTTELIRLESELVATRTALAHLEQDVSAAQKHLVSAKTAVRNAALEIIRAEAAQLAEEGITAQKIVEEKLTGLHGLDFAAMRMAVSPNGVFQRPLVLNQKEINWMHNLPNLQLIIKNVDKDNATEAWFQHYQELLLNSQAEL